MGEESRVSYANSHTGKKGQAGGREVWRVPTGQGGRAHLEVTSHGQLWPGKRQGVGTALCWRRSGRKERGRMGDVSWLVSWEMPTPRRLRASPLSYSPTGA